MISVFDIFKVGIGPSSSHTMGPMRAARLFAEALDAMGCLDRTDAVVVDLFGSLALTGRGHATDRAVLLGLEGDRPESLDLDTADARLSAMRRDRRLSLLGRRPIAFDESEHLRFRMDEVLPRHPNALRATAFDATGGTLLSRDYFSIGGGFVISSEAETDESGPVAGAKQVPYPFKRAADLFGQARSPGLTVPDLVLANERARDGAGDVRERLLGLWAVMRAAVRRGMTTEGILPGGLKVRRRAQALARRLEAGGVDDPLHVVDWVGVFAMAVNEENAAGGRVVTAPTNGASGLIPAVLEYYARYVTTASDEGVVRFLLTAGAIGILYKENASISGAEVGCQGEVGVACSMAAGGLVAAQGGSSRQIEQAAEIGMEHHLGLTCDPIGGLVQIPCIERNAVGAVKAIKAARLALSGEGDHRVTLDQVIDTMRATGADMQASYKETSLAGLAVHAVEC